MGPLAGLKIVEFDGLGPVPLCAMILADLGAEVVRVARPPSGAVAFDDVGGVVLHRGRPMVELDLKSADDLKQVRALISSADALIEGFRPGVMERLGLGPDVCLGLKPALVYGRMTGWGQTGPLAPRAGHDINYIALSGALHAIGDADRPPPPPLNLIGDYGAGAMMLAVGVLAALRDAAASGQGQVVDAAMTDGAAVLMSLFYAFRATGAWNDARSANMLDGGAPLLPLLRLCGRPLRGGGRAGAGLLHKAASRAWAWRAPASCRTTRPVGRRCASASPPPSPRRPGITGARVFEGDRRLRHARAGHGRGAPTSPQRRPRHLLQTRQRGAARPGAPVKPHPGGSAPDRTDLDG